jgi:hypothetical protein
MALKFAVIDLLLVCFASNFWAALLISFDPQFFECSALDFPTEGSTEPRFDPGSLHNFFSNFFFFFKTSVGSLVNSLIYRYR